MVLCEHKYTQTHTYINLRMYVQIETHGIKGFLMPVLTKINQNVAFKKQNVFFNRHLSGTIKQGCH